MTVADTCSASAPPAWFAVLVGSPETAADVFARACERLRAIWPPRAASARLRGGSVAPDDPATYDNQVLVLGHPGGNRSDLIAALKTLESELGRLPQQHPPVIDLDYLAEYATDGRECWRDAGKLVHPAFRDLLAEAAAMLVAPACSGDR